MLCFLIPLKPKVVSKNWERVSTLYSNTLSSCLNQSDQDIRVITVCHDRPCLDFKPDSRAEFMDADFSPPQEALTSITMQDKWRKVAIALVRARTYAPTFLMIVDADDLVSNRLAAFAHSHPQANGWIFKSGYGHRYGSRWFHYNDHFNCGTNAIIHARCLELPCSMDKEAIARCRLLTHGHTAIEQGMAEAGHPLAPLPFPGATYVYGHGDNDSHEHLPFRWHGLRFHLGQWRRLRYASPSLRQEFGVPRP